ncbi:MAG: hypothetical protein HQ512_13450 [Rhodospirillales bacterium]|nr:hypothetical protein [Rhodospirillales bacterium]
MATVPKAAPFAAPTNISRTRSSPPTRVASAGGGNVDELQNTASVSFGASSYAFNEEDHSSFNRAFNRNDRRNSRPQITGLFSAPTQAFTALLEAGDTSSGKSDAAGETSKAPFAGLVSKAIAVYENNAKIISGNSNILGTSFSIVL